ncbi:VapE family protein [Cupriavidus taiwanensis]|uniref:VapE domain-containing protein n=1 Tax=Cupriavidus taiwanensis TaxID=164546 RepID=UPI00253F67AD|nr:VapE domain-containing protein [Cupriavidus taiwanensis]MDK3021721.1 VapE family protein [Cupriavidus taiwanensis]
MNAPADLARCMPQVAAILLGQPNPDCSKPTELRFGKRGSLSIDLENGVWHDHEANQGGGVLDLIARETGKTGRAAIEWLERQGIKPANDNQATAPRKRFNVVAAYDYYDADGVLLFQVCRLDPKDFRQRRPDGNGGWSWSVKGVQPVPYRLPQLLARPDDPVFIAEGEKDCDALTALGLVATCNAGGANKWPDALTQYFAGRHVVVLPDNDESGREHVQLVTRKLSGVAASVRVLDLAPHWPAMPYKGDVSDWLAAGHDAAELLALAKDAPSANRAPVPANDNTTRPTNPFEAMELLARHGIVLAANSRQEPYPNLDNCIAVLQGHLRFAGRIWYDTFHQEIMTTWDCEEPRQWVDADRLRVATVFQRDFGLSKFGDEIVEKAAIAVAHADQRDELRDWLKSLRWDGTPRLDAWLQHAVGAPADEYHNAIGRNFILAMVARGLVPGCKADTMPVFEGAQGAGKSRLLSILGGKYYAELTESLDTKDFFVVIQGKWLVEIAELDAFRRADVTRIKQVLSAQQDRCRLPYAKRAVDLPRRVVFAGTTNEQEYLRDPTGARRFWPLTVARIDHDWLQRNREQLFAEAVERFQDGASWWDVPAEAAKEQTEARRETDAWENAIAEYCLGRSEVMVPEVLNALGVELARQGKAEQMRAARALAALGFHRKKVRRASRTFWAWVRDADDDDSAPF